MAEILSSLVKPAMEELGRITLVKIKHLFTYLCCFNNNIQSLRDEAGKLEDSRAGLQRDVVAAENNAELILPEVTTWLENARTKIQVDKSGIDDQIPTLKNGCWGVKSRYRLSRKAVKVTGEMKQLIEERYRFNRISTPPLPAAQAEIPLGTTYEFHSRKQIEEEIIEAMRAKEVTTMGICGMGGVGKTTMAKRIMDKVKKEDIFEEIFMVVVSQEADLLKIQGAIAECLGLKLGEETLFARATKLLTRLTRTKRILIVLDDVWEKLKLEDLGIPCGNERCTILLTSRNKDVLKKLDAQKIWQVEILSETEAWFLFRENAGHCVEYPNLLSAAEKVARECKCLPIALITVGGALNDQTNITFWEDALQQLKSFNPEDMPDVIKDVYNPLKLSYTKLESRHAKSLFLLCTLFLEDEDISLEELTFYCMGLRVFGNLDNFSDTSNGAVEQIRKRVFTTVDKLKNRFLLLKGKDEHHVRMHDVVRDVAIYIASNEAKEGSVDVKFNSLRSSSKVTRAWVSMLSEKTSSLLRMHASTINYYSLFEEMKELNVLSYKLISFNLQSWEIEVLKNLRTLRLEKCRLKPFSVVGELLSLEILYCTACHDIKELPVEIGKLNKLKLIQFSRCPGLKRIPPGVISNLVELEEFTMRFSFRAWESAAAAEVEGQERRNACLNEFENLSKLTCLEIEIEDTNLAAEEICFPPSIVKYIIKIGRYYGPLVTHHEKYIYLNLPREINSASWVRRFVSSADVVKLIGDGSIPFDLRQTHNTKLLTFEDCSTVKEVVDSTTASIHDDWSKYDVFPILKELCLFNLPKLEEVYDGTVLDHSNSLRNLQRLELIDLPALKHLWKQRPNRNIVSFVKLREIEIQNCNNLHNLFSFTTSKGTYQISTGRSIDDLLCTQRVHFPMLEYLGLDGIDKLEVIWNIQVTEGSNSFRNLTTLELSNMPAMTQLWTTPSANVSLNNLSKIRIDGCHKLCSLFPSTMSMNILLQLAELEIKNCKIMEQVWLNEENENDGNQCHTIRLPKLLKLNLDSLESLRAFGEGIKTIEFPMLEDMNIHRCPKLMSLLSTDENNEISDGHDHDTFHLFCSQKVSFGSLKKICIGFHDKSNIWCDLISHGFFSQLEVFEFAKCKGIKSLFSSTITENLVNLKQLIIQECEEMVKVIEDDEEMLLCEKPHNILFPNLTELNLEDLPKLESFCNWKCDFRLPSLEVMRITRCPLLKQFSSMGFVVAPNLNFITMDLAPKNVGELNSLIQQHHENRSEDST